MNRSFSYFVIEVVHVWVMKILPYLSVLILHFLLLQLAKLLEGTFNQGALGPVCLLLQSDDPQCSQAAG